GAGTPRRVDQEQQFHQVLRRRVRRLDDEDVPAADVLVDLDEDLAVGEAADRHRAERLPQVLRHLLGERPVGRTGEKQELAPRQGEFRHVSAENRRQRAGSQVVGLCDRYFFFFSCFVATRVLRAGVRPSTSQVFMRYAAAGSPPVPVPPVRRTTYAPRVESKLKATSSGPLA